ncbi:hypothetical protein HZ326_3388 [Fusarium oxysporum f. sp. albedinis]|nr:hypothetical protein HZ326_3388 [Fusarium oxysporum f. sp. albedinis]
MRCRSRGENIIQTCKKLKLSILNLNNFLPCPFVCLGPMPASHRHVAIDVDENNWKATTVCLNCFVKYGCREEGNQKLILRVVSKSIIHIWSRS